LRGLATQMRLAVFISVSIITGCNGSPRVGVSGYEYRKQEAKRSQLVSSSGGYLLAQQGRHNPTDSESDHALAGTRSEILMLPAEVPAYVSGLSAYEVLQMRGAYAPVNETMEDVTPSEWITNDPGFGALSLVIRAWSGGAGDAENRKLYIFGGGHGDSANNGLYVYDFSDDGTGKPVGFSLPSQSAVADVVASQESYADGLPVARHTYDGCFVYDGNFYSITGSRYMDGASASNAVYYPNTDSWSYIPDPVNENFWHGTVVDPATGKALVYYIGRSVAHFLDLSSNTFGATIGVNAIGGLADGITAIWDSTRSRVVVIGENVNRLWNVDFADESLTSQSTFTPKGDAGILAVGGLSGFHDEARDVYWIFGGKDESVGGFTNLYEMDPVTFQVTAHALTGDALNPLDAQGSFKRFVWMPDWRTIGFVTSHHNGAFLIKIPD
jgi:hypothetical protein